MIPETSQSPASSEEAVPADVQAYARLYGEPVFDLPQDLYIPPDALEVFLDSFEGPLDLLLYLIRRQNFDVLDIPMAALTRQYLTYVEEIRQRNLELAAEYLLMAAMLIDIKSRMLLPAPVNEETGEEEDPRAELVRRLLVYEQMKQAAAELDKLPRVGRDFEVGHVLMDLEVVEHLPEVRVEDLAAAWQSILRRARLNAHHQITREQLSVREHMSLILRELSQVRFMEFTELFMIRVHLSEPVAVIVVHFIAMLELVKESLLDVTQAQAYAPIYVRLPQRSHEG